VVILIVDDEFLILELLTTMLEMHNYKTLSSSSGEEALILYEKHKEKITHIIMDLRLKGNLSGLDASRHIRTENKKVKIIITSGLIDNKQKEHIKELGIDAILEKPFQINDLLNII
jgi:DNA-binding response OmpR family regulator